jgi:hypothetical protein
MSRISPSLDNAMAERGFVRVGILKWLFRYESSGGATRWVRRNLTKDQCKTFSGSCWVNWTVAWHKYNETGQADLLNLPKDASVALAEARQLAADHATSQALSA